MSDCTKYHVILMYPEIKGAQHLEDWLNERCELGEELVTVYKDKFIFKKNAYIVSITRTDGNHDKLD